jgi:hypothetical protein
VPRCPVIRRAPQEGQKPRRLQLNATSFSAWQSSQRVDELVEQRLLGAVACVSPRIAERGAGHVIEVLRLLHDSMDLPRHFESLHEER